MGELVQLNGYSSLCDVIWDCGHPEYLQWLAHMAGSWCWLLSGNSASFPFFHVVYSSHRMVAEFRVVVPRMELLSGRKKILPFLEVPGYYFHQILLIKEK